MSWQIKKTIRKNKYPKDSQISEVYIKTQIGYLGRDISNYIPHPVDT